MFTHPDELDEFSRARVRRYLTPDEFANYESSVAKGNEIFLKAIFVLGVIVVAVARFSEARLLVFRSISAVLS